MSQETLDREADEPIDETGPVLISEITPRNFLSFGPDTAPIELRSLNVLIGANGSGKSNLIEAIAFLRAAPTGFQRVTGAGGGVTKWVWKGAIGLDASVEASINVGDNEFQMKHYVGFRSDNFVFQLTNEHIEDVTGLDAESRRRVFVDDDDGPIIINGEDVTGEINSRGFDPNASVLALFRDAQRFPQLLDLTEQYMKIGIYRDWRFGRDNVLRFLQNSDASQIKLEEDYSNIGVFLNYVSSNGASKEIFRERLADIYRGADDLEVVITEEGALVSMTEGDYGVSAMRLSDGTLRYLALIAILCDPHPPPLICIEEPELGLHPDLIHILADMLKEASQRTQLIVTTHSDTLVSAFTNDPEAVLICEKWEGQTELTRLEKEEMAVWLKDYSLGSMWRSGQLGGTRW